MGLLMAGALFAGGCGADDEVAGTTTTIGDTTTTTTTAERGRDCSASELEADLTEQPGLPEPVADTRRQIVRAAVACDYDALGDLAEGTGDLPFTYSFGDSGDPARFWQREEREGTGQPLRHLVEILGRPHGAVEAGGKTRYAWPSAFTYDSWKAVPEADREALRPLYDEEDFRFFEDFGGYIGYRAIILEDGTWTVFVAGD